MVMTYGLLLGSGNILLNEQGAQWIHGGKKPERKSVMRESGNNSFFKKWMGKRRREKLAKVKQIQ